MKRPKLSQLTTGKLEYRLPDTTEPKRLEKVIKIAQAHSRSHLHEVTIDDCEFWLGKASSEREPGYWVHFTELSRVPGTLVVIRHRYRRAGYYTESH
jgi:hypothetical protein